MNSIHSASNHEALPQASDDSAVAQSFGNSFYTISDAANISGLPQDELLRLGCEGEVSFLVPAPSNLGIWICDAKAGRARTNSLTNPTMLILETESCWEVLTYGHGTQRDFRIGYEYDERFDEFQVRYPFSTLRELPNENAVWGFMDSGARADIEISNNGLYVHIADFKKFLNRQRITLKNPQRIDRHKDSTDGTEENIAPQQPTIKVLQAKTLDVASPSMNPALRDFDALPDSAMVSIKVVCALFGCSPATVWRRVKNGDLVEPKRLGGGTTRWSVGELRAELKRITDQGLVDR